MLIKNNFDPNCLFDVANYVHYGEERDKSLFAHGVFV